MLQLDNSLRWYYKLQQQPYDDEEGVGKFAEWTEENGYDTDTIAEEFNYPPEETSIVEYDDNFPSNKAGQEKIQHIFNIFKTSYFKPNVFYELFTNNHGSKALGLTLGFIR